MFCFSARPRFEVIGLCIGTAVAGSKEYLGTDWGH